MTAEQMAMLAGTCAAAFSRSEPKDSAIKLWAAMCDMIPPEAIPFIRNALMQEDSWPANFGKAVYARYCEWKTTQPGLARERRRCPDCDREIPGYFHVWKAVDGQLLCWVQRCLCNDSPEDAGWMPMSKSQAVEAGYSVRGNGGRRP